MNLREMRMHKFSGLYLTILSISCAATLAFAAGQTKSTEGESPYSKGAQTLKEEKVEGEYFNRKYVPEESATDGDADDDEHMDGLNLENIKTPSPHDAETPTDPYQAAAQNSLRGLISRDAIEDSIAQEEAQEAVGEPGHPDTPAELAADLWEKEGLDVKRQLTPEEIARNKALALGLAGH